MFADYLFYFLKQFILIFIDVISFALLFRAILSWFDPMSDFRLSRFLYLITEPIILPVRRLCEKMNWFQGVPLDVPFTLTWVLLMIIQVLLSAL